MQRTRWVSHGICWFAGTRRSFRRGAVLCLALALVLSSAALSQATEGCRSFTQTLDKKGLLTSGRSASFWYDCRSLSTGAWHQQCLSYCDTKASDGPERWGCKAACEAMKEMLDKN